MTDTQSKAPVEDRIAEIRERQRLRDHFDREFSTAEERSAHSFAQAHASSDCARAIAELTASQSRERALTEERNALKGALLETSNENIELADRNAALTSENKALKELLDKIARDLPQRGPSGFEDFSTAYSRIKHMARTAFLTTTNDGGGK